MAVAVPSREESAVIPSLAVAEAAAPGAADVLARLGSDTGGLPEEEAARRLRVVGPNAVPSHRARAMGRCRSRAITPERGTGPVMRSRSPERAVYAPLRDRFEPGTPLWVTETADAACGGNSWASAFLDSFRYVEQLGRLARRGVQVIAHNTLASSGYGCSTSRLSPWPAGCTWKNDED